MPRSSNWLATLCRSLTERASLSIFVTISLSPSRKSLMLHAELFDLILLQIVFPKLFYYSHTPDVFQFDFQVFVQLLKLPN